MNQAILELLISNYFFLLYFTVLTLALLRYRQYFDSILKYFPIFIGYTILNELLGLFILNFDEFRISSSEEYHYANNAIYNIYDWVFFLYFIFIFHKIIKAVKFKIMIKYGVMLYFIVTAINPFFENWIIFPQTFSWSVGSAVLIMSITLYFIDSKNRMERNKYLLAWIGIGLLIFNLFFPPILLLGIYNEEFYLEFNLRQVHHILIVVMYVCFSIGFLQMKSGFSAEDT